MRSNTWPPGEWDEFDSICREAESQGRSTGERARIFGELIDGAVQAHRVFARDIERDAMGRGYLSIFRQWQKSKAGSVVVAHDGRVMTKPRVIGVRRQTEDGTVYHQQTLFDFMTWDELRQKRREYLEAVSAYTDDVALVDRLIALHELAPDALNPAQAAEVLGTTVDAWLAEDTA